MSDGPSGSVPEPTPPPDPVALLASLSPEERAALHAVTVEQAWMTGRLRYKLHATQLLIRDAIEASASSQRKFFALCSRRLGKSFLLVTLAFETALRTPNAQVLFLAPQQSDAARIAKYLATTILTDCPKRLRPDFNATDKLFAFKNGSVVRFHGLNAERADALRGGDAHLVIIDEAGFVDGLSEIIRSVLLPMTLLTKGRIILASTPPPTPGHDSATIYEELASTGATARFTILDAPSSHMSDEQKTEALLESKEDRLRIPAILRGDATPATTAARREYFAEFVTDANLVVFPEYAEHRTRILVEPNPERPPYYDAYVTIDPGSRDKTGILFGHVDFVRGRAVIEDEALLTNPTTQAIVDVIRSRESSLWEGRRPYQRVSDTDLRLIQDLSTLHQLSVVPAIKGAGSMLASVQLVRHLIQNGQLLIHPRCRNLDRQLLNAIWNSRATDVARPSGEVEQAIDGHMDLVAALRYFCRALSFQHNPYPHGYYMPGAPGGPPAGSYVSHKGGAKQLSFLDATPMGKRLSRRR